MGKDKKIAFALVKKNLREEEDLIPPFRRADYRPGPGKHPQALFLEHYLMTHVVKLPFAHSINILSLKDNSRIK